MVRKEEEELERSGVESEESKEVKKKLKGSGEGEEIWS